ncbi:PAS domain-containing sensor histidine kinase [Pontibacter sp. HSC-36F09]|uniref:PAS domain-containing sensor histidine kinase n=1 Tax=Pontibacter sp. HSC-36F09 TaxID=2910966 RepID=UPI00209F2F6D|nr:PAS domain-containing sensor histidine kinase [Pontibacter sp. HSC-36F09]MCP2044210.1 signal transduction histidine kinase [Pontibacter sp. HSC-36F09]
MNHLNVIDQIGQQSPKILFQFNLSQNRFDYLSPAFYDIWEMEESLLQEHPQQLLDSVVEDDRPAVERCWQRLLKGDHVDEMVRIEQSGLKRYIRYIAYPIFDSDQRVAALAGIAENVTQQRDFVNYLTEFGQRKNSALEMVAHDLRGPLAVVKSVASLLRQDIQDDKKQELEHYTDIIETACVQCTDLIQDLLSEEHLQSPEVYVNKIRMDISEQIRSVVGFYQKGRLVQQQFVLQLPDDPLMAELDQIKFSQILNNLISNSIKFTPPTGTITIRAYQDVDWAVVEHSDNGIGIPEHLLPQLFERRSNASRKGLNGEKSRGLGLAIVYELVRLQGGTISVESREHEGTRFTIRLPRYAA